MPLKKKDEPRFSAIHERSVCNSSVRYNVDYIYPLALIAIFIYKRADWKIRFIWIYCRWDVLKFDCVNRNSHYNLSN